MPTAPMQTPGPGAGPPQRPQRKRSNVLWWVLGLASVAIVLLVVGGLLLAGLFVKNVRVSEKGRQVQITTPAGELTVKQGAANSTGLPVYPGATLVERGGDVQISGPEESRVGITVVRYHSADPVEKVDAWYRERLGAEFKRDTGDAHGKIRVGGVMTEGVAYVSDRDDLVRFVAISKKNGGVEIALGRIGKQETQ